MVERTSHLDAVFASLADPTRRDILRRLQHRALSVSEVAAAYERQMSLAAVSKHLVVLERARLVRKRRSGREHIVALSPPALRDAAHHLERYRQTWEKQLAGLEAFLKEKK